MSMQPKRALSLSRYQLVECMELLYESVCDLAVKGLTLDLPSADDACTWLNLEGDRLLETLKEGELIEVPRLYKSLKMIGAQLEVELLERCRR